MAPSTKTIRATPTPAVADILEQHTRHELDWVELVKAGPEVLGILARCVIAANKSSSAFQAPLNIGAGRLKYATLQANLQDLIDVGQDAFIESDRTMLRLMKTADWVCRDKQGLVQRVVSACDPEIADFALGPALQKLLETTKGCVAETAALYRRYEDWKALTDEIRKACEETGGDVDKRTHDIKRERSRKDAKKTFKEEKITQLEEELVRRKESEREQKERVEKAEQMVPEGWGAIIQDVSQDFLAILNTKANSISNAFVGAGGIFGYTVGVQFQDSSHSTESDTMSGAATGLKLASDVNLKLASDIIAELRLLEEILVPRTSIPCFSDERHKQQPQILDIQQSLTRLCVTNNEEKDYPELDDLLKKTVKLADDIEKGMRRSREPGPSSSTSDYARAKTVVSIPKTRKALMPCSFDNHTDDDDDDDDDDNRQNSLETYVESKPIIVLHPQNQETAAPASLIQRLHGILALADKLRGSFSATNKREREALRQAADMHMKEVQRARGRLAEAKRAHSEVKSELAEARYKYHMEKRELSSLVQELEELQSDGHDLHTVREFLQTCCKDLNQVSAHVVKLQRFFSGIAIEVEHLFKQDLGGFLESGQKLLEADTERKKNYYFQEVERGAEGVSEHFRSIGNIAAKYHDISENHIMTGIEMINQLVLAGDSVSNEESINTVVDKLQDAYDDITDMVIIQHNEMQQQSAGIALEVNEIPDDEIPTESPSHSAATEG